MADQAAPMSPELLDRLRRGFPLRMDAQGALWFEGDALDHPGLVAYFREHLDADDEGAPIVWVDGKYVYLQCDDTPLRVSRIAPREGRPWLLLDDGRQLPLDPATLIEESGRGLRCAVPSSGRGRPLAARLRNAAAMDLDRWIEWHDDAAHLRIGDELHPVPAVDPDADTRVVLH